jgi:adenylate cyclase class IV
VATELELKAVVGDADALRRRLRAAGAELSFSGLMHDRRYDRDGALASRDEVLRVRTFAAGDAPLRIVLGWKGPVSRSAGGYKQREEHECQCTGASPADILERIGFSVVHAIDRWVDQFALANTMIRIETYPRMDTLVEVDGAPPAIEAAVALTGIPRDEFTAESLDAFVQRFERRSGERAVLSSDGVAPEALPWSG